MADNEVKTLHDIVTMKNPDDEDFTFEYDRARGNYPYLIKAGAIARFPRFLYNHAKKHLIDKMLLKQKIKTNNDAARADLESKIFVNEEVFQHSEETPEAEKLRKEVEELNKPSELPVLDMTPPEEAVATEPPVEKSKPTRQELLDYAKDKAMMVLDKKTLEKLDKMTDDELASEIGYTQ